MQILVAREPPLGIRAIYDGAAGLYAFVIVPRAPNFSALRRVSSNLERA